MAGTKINLIRLLMAAALLGAWSHLFGFGISGVAFPFLFVSGCIGFGVGDLALFQTYPRLGARRTIVLVQCLAAPFGALIEWAWLNHAPTLVQAAFGMLILVGVGVALLPRKADEEPTHGVRVGILFGTLAAFAQGFGAVLSRKAYAVAENAGQIFHGVGDGVNATYQRLLGGVFVCAIFFICLKIANKADEARQTSWRRAWPWIVSNGLAGPAFGVTCYQWALMSAPTNIVLPIVATTPLAVIPLAHFMDGERITKRAVLGGFIAVAGVIGLARTR